MDALQAAHDRIRVCIGKAETAADEALRERASFLTSAADPAPICRALRRLRHDLAILGRALSEPLPEAASAILLPPCQEAAAAVSALFTAAAAAIAKGQPPGSLAALDAAFDAQAHAVTEMRRRRVLHGLPDDDLTRIFGLGFALEQLHRDLRDLADRGAELAGPPIAEDAPRVQSSAD
jgi:hypothetical protein